MKEPHQDWRKAPATGAQELALPRPNVLAFSETGLADLTRELLAAAPAEAGAVLLAGYAKTRRGTRILVRESISVPIDGYLVQQDYRLAIAPAFLAPLIKRSRLEGWTIVLAHSHPFGGDGAVARFSPTDDEGEAVLMPTLFSRAGDRPHASLVVSPNGFDARLRWAAPHGPNASPPTPIERLLEVGPQVRIHERRPSAIRLDPKFDRSVRALGAEGQALLGTLRVGIVGVGGTGSLVAQQLALLGVGELVLVDFDTVERTNLNRLAGATPRDVGRSKVEVAAEAVRRDRPDVRITPVSGSVLRARDAAPLLETDFIFGCTDSHGSRALINQLAYQYLIPAIDLGVRIDAADGKVKTVTGRVQMLAPGVPCLVCQDLLDPEIVRRDLLSPEERSLDPYVVGEPIIQPAVVSLNSVVAGLAVTMFLSAVTGFPSAARHVIYRADTGQVRPVTSSRRSDCLVCSLGGALARGSLWPLPWRLD